MLKNIKKFYPLYLGMLFIFSLGMFVDFLIVVYRTPAIATPQINYQHATSTVPKYLDININVAKACNWMYLNANK